MMIGLLPLFSLSLAAPAVQAEPIPMPSAETDAALGRDDPFAVPSALAEAVEFWTELFLRHGSDRVVVHDRENLQVVWLVLELPKDEDGLVNEYAVERHTRLAVDELRRRLRRLETDQKPADDEDAALLSLAGGADSPYLQGASERLRAQRGVADAFREGLGRYRGLRPAIHRVLEEERVPVEIAALPFVESMFNPTARSYAGAAGLWQLMPATARSLGLCVRRGGLDERLDVLKATRAAARMLRRNYEALGSWPLAITAYNHGPNGVRRAVAALGSADLVDLIENYRKSTWGFASKNFYAEFLAAVHVLAYHVDEDAGLALSHDPWSDGALLR